MNYAIAHFLPAEAIDAIIAADYQATMPNGLSPRTALGACALGIGLGTMDLGLSYTHLAPSAGSVGIALERHLECQHAAQGVLWDVLALDRYRCTVVDAAADFIRDFDRGVLLGDALRTALGRPTLAEAAVAAAEAILAATAVAV